MIQNKFQKGFTLLEILIAVSILAAAFLALLSAQGGAFRSSERAEYLTKATMLARLKMTEVEVELDADVARGKFPEEDFDKTGEFDKPFDDFRWKSAIHKVEIPVVSGGGDDEKNALVGTYMKNVMDQISKAVREVTVTVYWGDKDKPEAEQPQLSVTTHRVKLQ